MTSTTTTSTTMAVTITMTLGRCVLIAFETDDVDDDDDGSDDDDDAWMLRHHHHHHHSSLSPMSTRTTHLSKGNTWNALIIWEFFEDHNK